MSGEMAHATLPETKHTPGPWRDIGDGYVEAGSAPLKFRSGWYDSAYLTSEAREEWQANAALIARAPDLLAENERLREALTPSAGTKAAYIGEFTFSIELSHPRLGSDWRRVSVPWDTVKEIMAAIRERAALSEQEGKPAKDVGREGAFRAGYKAGFDAAKHPFHMPVADEAFAFFSEQEGK